MKHCKICALQDNHPGISLDEEEVCNLCRLQVPPSMASNYRYSNDNYQYFLASAPRTSSEYDCLFMYSGGKDSTYMLDKFVNGEGRRVLAYTFDVPFQSEHALGNFQTIQEKIPIRYYRDADDDKIRMLMQHVFNHVPVRQPAGYLDEKTPCMLCRDFFVLRAIVFAFKNDIPFLIFCADPQQIVTIQSHVPEIIKAFYARVGRDMTERLFGDDLEDLLFEPEERLPRIIFPFIGMRHSYNPAKMISELKEKGMYTTSPLETHCTLFPLLNYYSFHNYNCSFYRLNMASQVRGARIDQSEQVATFGIEFNKDGSRLVETEARYKQVIMDIIRKEGSKEAQRAELDAVFKAMAFDQDAADYLIEKYMALHEVASDLGIQLPVN